MLKAFERGDRDAWLSLHDPDHEVIPADVWPETGPVKGREAAWDFYVTITDTLEPQSFADDAEIESAGPDTVLVHQRNRMRGRASGAWVDLDFWVVTSFRGGRVARDEWFATRAEALEAAGLQE
jgi:ketosteroid isomerase-like protein